MFGVKVISHHMGLDIQVTQMTSEECITKVLSSPDLKCPLCGKHLEVWVLDDVPLHRCSICGGLGMRPGRARMERIMAKAKTGAETDARCPGCGSGMVKASLGKLRFDTCVGCDWVFVEEGDELQTEEVEEGENCSHYAVTLRSIGKRYEFILSKT
jgi:Zn-finger nucleic acid-binding protein